MPPVKRRSHPPAGECQATVKVCQMLVEYGLLWRITDHRSQSTAVTTAKNLQVQMQVQVQVYVQVQVQVVLT